MTTLTTAIAQHLNVEETAITKIEEWSNVLFAVVKGLGARFVSKKVKPQQEDKVMETKKVKSIKVLPSSRDHMTATEKRHIKEILGLGMLQGKVRNKKYFLTQKEENIYSVKLSQTCTDDWGRKFTRDRLYDIKVS